MTEIERIKKAITEPPKVTLKRIVSNDQLCENAISPEQAEAFFNTIRETIKGAGFVEPDPVRVPNFFVKAWQEGGAEG